MLKPENSTLRTCRYAFCKEPIICIFYPYTHYGKHLKIMLFLNNYAELTYWNSMFGDLKMSSYCKEKAKHFFKLVRNIFCEIYKT